jgi:hypothetical protein
METAKSITFIHFPRILPLLTDNWREQGFIGFYHHQSPNEIAGGKTIYQRLSSFLPAATDDYF